MRWCHSGGASDYAGRNADSQEDTPAQCHGGGCYLPHHSGLGPLGHSVPVRLDLGEYLVISD